MHIDKRVAGAIVGIGLLAASFGGRIALAQQAQLATPPAAVEEHDDGGERTTSYTGSIAEEGSEQDGKSEADEPTALQGQAKIDEAKAKAVAEAANPGTTARKAELEDENGYLVYSVELSNGVEVKVDAGNARILHTEQAGDGQESEGEQEDSGRDVPEYAETGSSAQG